MIISTTKRFNYRFKIQPKFNHRFNQILNLYQKNDSKQKVLRGALTKRRDLLWIRKMLFQCRKKESCLPNKTFSLKRKNNVWGSLPEPIEILFTFCRIFGDSNAAKRGGNRGGGGGFWKSLGIFHAWESYGNCWIHLSEYWKTTGMQSLCTDSINC